jgi:2-oxoglutarate ferredoxin oxidoreductase subunit alpha
MIRPVTLWPFPSKPIAKAAEKVQAFLTVEMSMGQMVDDVRLAVNGKVPVSFFGHTGGIVPSPAEVLEQIEKLAGGDR